jgi:hypothetical protein
MALEANEATSVSAARKVNRFVIFVMTSKGRETPWCHIGKHCSIPTPGIVPAVIPSLDYDLVE